MAEFGQFGQTQFPFLHQAPYFPANVGRGGAMGDMSNILSMFAGPMLGNLAGPGNFVPSMLPAQSLADQFAMKQYTSQTNMARFSAMRDQNPNVANTLLGARSMVTNTAPSELNREQATQGAEALNNPIFQMIAGHMIGPENLEMMLHGSQGNPQALAQATNRMGFFRRDPMGGQRMEADSLTAFSRGVYSELYRPDGDIERMTEGARQGGADGAANIQALKQAAGLPDRDVVSDTDIAQRLVDDRGADEVGKLYEKYVAGGKATDAATQAKELTKFHRAISSAGVLKDNETSIAGLAAAAERKPLDDMHGFSAGQAAQMQEELLRRGMLPEAIGHMSQNERLRTIDKEMSQMGEGRLNDMARDLAHQSLTNDKTEVGARYRQKTEVEQRAQVEQELPHFRQQLDQDRKKLSAFASGQNDPDTGQPISPEELDKLGSMGAMGATADASRVGQSVKEFAGAVDAVREIFGDNGNPNAPMPALMAALNGLTQGKIANMNAGAVQATLRKMQQAARETGIGFEQMAAMSTQMGAQGQLLGLSATTTMSNQASAMSALKVMQDSGATTSQAAGALSRDELLAKEGQLLQAGAAADNSKSMAAIAAMYETDPGRFAGTKVEAMAKAYLEGPDGTGDYEFGGKKFNLYEETGRTRGFAAFDAVLEAEGQSGVGLADFQAIKLDPALEEVIRKNASAGRRTQRFETLQELTEQLGAGFAEQTDVASTGSYKNLDVDAQRAVQRELMSTIVDAGQLERGERGKAVTEQLPARIKTVLEQQGMNPADAATAAQEIAGGFTGDKIALDRVISQAGAITKSRTGDTLAAQSQLNSTAQTAGALEQNRVDNAQAQRRTENPVAKTNPLGGFVSYLQDIGKRGENFNVADAAAAAFNVQSDSEMHRRMLKDVQPMMQELSAMRDEAFYTGQDAKKFAAEVRSPDAATRDHAVAELKRMGAVAADATVLTDPAAEKEATERVIAGMAPEEIEKIHASMNLSPLTRAKGDDRADHELMLDRIRDTDTFKATVAKKLQKENTYTVDSLTDAAKTGIGTVKDDAAADRYQMAVKSFENEDTARVFFKEEMARANIADDTQTKLSEALFGTQTADSEANFDSALQGLDPEVADRMKAIAGGVRFSRTLPKGSQLVRSATESDKLTPETAEQQEARRLAESRSAVQKQEGGGQSFLGGMLSNFFGYGANQTPTVSTSAATAGAAQKSDTTKIDSTNVDVSADKVVINGDIQTSGGTVTAAQTQPVAATSSPATDTQTPVTTPKTAVPESSTQSTATETLRADQSLPLTDANAADLKKQQRALASSLSPDEQGIMVEYTKYDRLKNAETEAKTAGDESQVEELQENLKKQQELIVAQRTAQRMGLPLSDGVTTTFSEVNGALSGEQLSVAGKLLDDNIFAEETRKFEQEMAGERPPARAAAVGREIVKLQQQIETREKPATTAVPDAQQVPAPEAASAPSTPAKLDTPLPPLDKTLDPEANPTLSSANVPADAGDFMPQAFPLPVEPTMPGQQTHFRGPSPFSAPAATRPVPARYLATPDPASLPQINIPPPKSRLPETLDNPLATLPTSAALQNETRHLDTAVNTRPVVSNAQQNSTTSGATDKNLNVVGKLEISGLREAILSASGSQPYTPAGDGPAIMGAETGFA